jgi:LysM repeat protein
MPPPSPVVAVLADTTQPVAVPAEYRVRSGDTLSGIAAKLLGDSDRYAEIFELNRDRAEPGGSRFTDPDRIQPGWTLALPAKGSTSHSASYSAHPETSKPTSSTKAKSSGTQQAHPAAGSSLSGWINQAIGVLKAHGYAVSYQAVYETAMHESSGNPDAVDRSDSNAAAGHPSIGLMQTIQPTFDEYALKGYGDIYNPVDNIIAAVRYAAANYGSLDDVVAERCGGSCWRGY